MKNGVNSIVAIFLGCVFLVATDAKLGSAQGMMGGGCGCCGMMNNMMGDMLPPMDPAQLPDPNSKGANLLVRFCTQCHNLPGPGLHTSTEWPQVVNRMVRRMRMMSGRGMMMDTMEAPTRDQVDAMTAYLQKEALKPYTGRHSPELDTSGGHAFSEVCSQCHALPDPGRHSSQEWPAVVERMKEHMASMGKSVPQEEKLREIVRFLKRHGTQPAPK